MSTTVNKKSTTKKSTTKKSTTKKAPTKKATTKKATTKKATTKKATTKKATKKKATTKKAKTTTKTKAASGRSKASPPVGKQMSFKATLEDWAEGLDYCAVPVPERVTHAMGTTGPVLVMAHVNASQPFKVSLFPVGGGQHYIRIKAKVRKETKTRTGDEVTIRFTVLDRADVAIPDDLRKALRAEGVLEAFQSIPPGKQNFTIRQIDEAAKPETRDKRIQKAVALAHTRREATSDRS